MCFILLITLAITYVLKLQIFCIKTNSNLCKRRKIVVRKITKIMLKFI